MDLNLRSEVRGEIWVRLNILCLELTSDQNHVDYLKHGFWNSPNRDVWSHFFFPPPPNPHRVKTLLWYRQIMSELRLSAVIGWAHLRIMRSGYKGLEQQEHESITTVTAVGHMFAADSLVSISRIRLHDFFFLWHIFLMLLFFYLLIYLSIREAGRGNGKVSGYSETSCRPPTDGDQLSALTSASKHPGLGSRCAQVLCLWCACACVGPRA